MHDSSLDRQVVLHEPVMEASPKKFVDYLSKPYLILLGDPGIGKTYLFKKSAVYENAKYMTVGSFVALSGAGCEGKLLYLDGLDEYRSRTGEHGLIYQLVSILNGLNLSGLRISCRVADWFGETDLDLFRGFFGEKQFAVLGLSRLQEQEITMILKGSGVSEPKEFLQEADARGLNTLIGNPQTLLMLSELVRSSNWPKSRLELFEKTSMKLLEEHDPARTRSGPGMYPSSQLLLPAGAICSSILISNVSGISMLGNSNDSNYPSYREINLEDSDREFSSLTRRAFEIVDPSLEAFTYTHRTIAEFLAAKWIVNQVRDGYPVRRLRNLIGVDGIPTSELRGLHAWIGTLLSEHSKIFIESDPLGIALYGDARNLSVHDRSYLLNEICRISVDNPWFRSGLDYVDGALGSLSGDDVVESFSEILNNAKMGFQMKKLVLTAIKNGPRLTAFVPVLLNVLTNDCASYSERKLAIDILLGYGELGKRVVVETSCNTSFVGEGVTHLKLVILGKLYSEFYRPNYMSEVILDYLKDDDDYAYGELLKLDGGVELNDIPDVLLELSNKISCGLDDGLNPNKKTELSNYVYRLIFEWLKGGEGVTSDYLNIFLGFANSIDKHYPNKREDVGLEAWISSCVSNKFDLFYSAFNSWEDDFSWSTVHDFICSTLNLYSSEDLTRYSLEIISSCRVLNEKHASLYEVAGSQIFAIGINAYPEFEEWVELGGASELIEKRAIASACTIDKWRVDSSKREREFKDRKVTIKAAELEALTATKEDMRSGKHVYNLSVLASHYFYNLEEGVDPRISIIERTGIDISEFVFEGFYEYLMADGHLTAHELSLSDEVNWKILLAGMDEVGRRGVGINLIPESVLRSVFSVGLISRVFQKASNGSRSRISLGWMNNIITERSDLAMSCIEDLARGALATKNEVNYGVDALFYYFPDTVERRKLILRLITDFPEMDITFLSKLICELLEDKGERTLLLKSIGSVLSLLGPLRSDRKAIWVFIGYMFEPQDYVGLLNDELDLNVDAIWEINLILTNSKFDVLGFMSVSQLEYLAVRFGSRYPYVNSPTGIMDGVRNPWDASQIVIAFVNRLSTILTVEASTILNGLLVLPMLKSYGHHIKYSYHNQLRSLREFQYIQPDWPSTIKALKNDEPVSISDLHALVLDQLDTIKIEIRHSNTNIFRTFWREGAPAKPCLEDQCRDRLIELLKPKLTPLKLHVEPESYMADDKRADVVVISRNAGKLPLELKRDFNKQLWTACEDQLERLYASSPDSSGYGVYVVFWFGGKRGSSLPRMPEGIDRPVSAGELEKSLNSLIAKEKSHRIVAVVIDVEIPEKPR